MQTSAKVLVYGRDASLLETRQWVLQRAGFTVGTTGELDEAEQAIGDGEPTVLILCHTLLPAEYKTILDLAHTEPHVATLLLEGTGPMRVAAKSDELLMRHHGPQELIAAVTRLAARAESGGSEG